MSRAERFTARVTHHGEGPFWDEARQRLLLVDMLEGAVVEVDGGGGATRRSFGRIAAVIRARRGGGYVLAEEHRVLLLTPDLTEDRALPDVLDDPGIRMNEGGCDPQGRFYIGTMAYDQTPGAGRLYRIEPDGSVGGVVLPSVTISNGLQWTAAGDTVYYDDTPTSRVQAFDFDADAGRFSNGRTFVDTEGLHPDGMAIDVEDGIWVAFYGGGRVHRYDPSGALTEVVEVPGATQVTACTFGGPDRRTLYISTSREHLSDDDQPDAGSVFRYEAGVAGAVPHAFAG